MKLNHIAVSMLLVLSFFMGCTKKTENTEQSSSTQTATSKEKARIKTIHGDIVFAFYPDKAPNTVKRIKELIKQGFYDGIIFHRVVPGFVIQAGDPTGTGRGGSGKKLKAEFNDLVHKKGTVAMARAMDPDSADSQFYIAMNPAPHLDGKYTIFGEVVEGLENIEKVVQGDKIISASIE